MIYTKGPAHYEQPLYQDLRDMLHVQSTLHADEPAYAYRLQPKGDPVRKTYAQLERDVQALGTSLLSLGLARLGDRVAILGENSYAWAVTHMAVLFGLGLSMPLDKQLALPEIISLCQRGSASVLAIDKAHFKFVEEIAAACPSIRTFILLHAPEKSISLPEDPRYFRFQELLAEGYRQLDRGDTQYTSLPIDPELAAGLYFTSGTTSAAKGVLLSHKNILSNCRNGLRSLRCKPGSSVLSILPLHHTFENTVGMFAQLSVHNCIFFNDGLRYFTYNLKDWKIEVILAVPLLLENIYKQMWSGILRQGKEKLIRRLIKVSRFLRKCKIDIRRKLFSKLLGELGGALNLIIAGAAALGPDVMQFFDDIGIDCMLGYGLTEAGPMITANNQKVWVPGTVGQPLADHEVRIVNGLDYSDEDHPGEVLARTDSIFVGYYQDEEATAKVLDSEGWLHTGDVGYLDARGCLHLTGRQKSIIVLTNGKKVFPEELEALLQQIQGIQAAFVWGETNARGNVDVCASVLIDRKKLPPEVKPEDEHAIQDWLHGVIADSNTKIPVYKAIKYFLWSDAGMPLTTTLKVRRALELQRIQSYLRTEGKTMREADRARMVSVG